MIWQVCWRNHVCHFVWFLTFCGCYRHFICWPAEWKQLTLVLLIQTNKIMSRGLYLHSLLYSFNSHVFIKCEYEASQWRAYRYCPQRLLHTIVFDSNVLLRMCYLCKLTCVMLATWGHRSCCFQDIASIVQKNHFLRTRRFHFSNALLKNQIFPWRDWNCS